MQRYVQIRRGAEVLTQCGAERCINEAYWVMDATVPDARGFWEHHLFCAEHQGGPAAPGLSPIRAFTDAEGVTHHADLE